MAKRSAQKKLVYEGAAARYRMLMMQTRDPDRRRMLEDMIARELERVKSRNLISAPVIRGRFGGAGIERA
jgi:hypothetical protein